MIKEHSFIEDVSRKKCVWRAEHAPRSTRSGCLNLQPKATPDGHAPESCDLVEARKRNSLAVQAVIFNLSSCGDTRPMWISCGPPQPLWIAWGLSSRFRRRYMVLRFISHNLVLFKLDSVHTIQKIHCISLWETEVLSIPLVADRQMMWFECSANYARLASDVQVIVS